MKNLSKNEKTTLNNITIIMLPTTTLSTYKGTPGLSRTPNSAWHQWRQPDRVLHNSQGVKRNWVGELGELLKAARWLCHQLRPAFPCSITKPLSALDPLCSLYAFICYVKTVSRGDYFILEFELSAVFIVLSSYTTSEYFLKSSHVIYATVRVP